MQPKTSHRERDSRIEQPTGNLEPSPSHDQQTQPKHERDVKRLGSGIEDLAGDLEAGDVGDQAEVRDLGACEGEEEERRRGEEFGHDGYEKVEEAEGEDWPVDVAEGLLGLLGRTRARGEDWLGHD